MAGIGLRGVTSVATLARFAADLGSEGIPKALREKMRNHLIDTLVAGICGEQTPLVQSARDAFDRSGSSLRDRVFLRGVSAHVLELDDTGGCDHSGVAVVPALAELLPHTTERTVGDLIVAMTIGYEIGRRTQYFLGGYTELNGRGWHSTPVCGPIGAAAAAAKLLGLDADGIADAMGLAASMSSGGWSFKSGGGNNKSVHGGLAAANGVQAAMLAQHGVQGSRDVFEDVWGGLGRTFALDGGDRDALLHGLGETWVAEDASIKPFPSCASSHKMVQLAEQAIVPQDIDLDTVTRIDISVGPLVAAMCGETSLEQLRHFNQRQLSIPYCVAVTLAQGEMSFEALNADPEGQGLIARLLARVIVTTDESIKDSHGQGTVTMQTTSAVWNFDTEDVADPKSNVITLEQVMAKSESLLRGAGRLDAVPGLRRLANAEWHEPALPLY